MKYLALDKDNVIVAIGNTLEYNRLGQPVFTLEDSTKLAFAWKPTIIELESIPSNVTAYKYCYLDGEFSSNPNYIEAPEADISVEELNAAYNEGVNSIDE